MPSTQESKPFPLLKIEDNLHTTSLLDAFPDIAKEANGWDPSQYSYGSKARVQWKCPSGHEWFASITNRTLRQSKCPYCQGSLVLSGQNDLATLHPEIAAQALGWNPSVYKQFSSVKKKWICKNGHTWDAVIADRTAKKRGCPYCSGSKLILGVNDLASQFPEIAAEALGWNPCEIKYGSKQVKPWLCPNGHIFNVPINRRTNMGTGCPECATHGYKQSKQAWIYLLKKANSQKVGITNSVKTRMTTHKRNGFTLIELCGPMDGSAAWEIEANIKSWLRAEKILIDGTHENWRTDDMRISSLLDLGRRAGLDQSSLELLS